MEEKVVPSGFGGQGVLLIGKLIALAGMDEGKHVSWVPSYGPEMRGGTANCTVIVSDEEISSPLAPEPDTLIIMNKPSLEKFEPDLKKGGTLIMNSSLIDIEPERKDIKVVSIAANEIAEKQAGNPKSANMVALGAYIAATGKVKMESVEKVLKAEMKGPKEKFLAANLKALEFGFKAVK